MEVEVNALPPVLSGHGDRTVGANDPVPVASAREAPLRRMTSASLPGPSGDRHPRTNSQFPRQFHKWSETPAPEGVQEGQLFLEVFWLCKFDAFHEKSWVEYSPPDRY